MGLYVQPAESDLSESPSRPWYQFSLKWILCAIAYIALAFGVWKNDIESTLGGILAVPLLISTMVIVLALLRWLLIWIYGRLFRYDDEVDGLPTSQAPAPNPPKNKNQSGPHPGP